MTPIFRVIDPRLPGCRCRYTGSVCTVHPRCPHHGLQQKLWRERAEQAKRALPATDVATTGGDAA